MLEVNNLFHATRIIEGYPIYLRLWRLILLKRVTESV